MLGANDKLAGSSSRVVSNADELPCLRFQQKPALKHREQGEENVQMAEGRIFFSEVQRLVILAKESRVLQNLNWIDEPVTNEEK